MNRYCAWEGGYLLAREGVEGGWTATWLIFAGYALVVAVVFAAVFRYRHDPVRMGEVRH